MKHSAFAPGKIILSGEYAVVFGKRGIAIPSSMGLTATFEERASADGMTVDLPGGDERTKAYVGRVIAECAALRGDAFRGSLRIENQLPFRKGMGSSTSLVVAVYRALFGDGSGDEARARAKRVEDAVNPGNSGLDFAVIWENKPVVFTKGSAPQTLDQTIELPHMKLIDTGLPEQSTPELVAWVTSRTEDPAILAAFDTIDQCTQRLLAGESVLTVFPDHHRAQVALGVVPAEVQALIASIEREGGAAKVIGAGSRTGGGGMVLAVRPN